MTEKEIYRLIQKQQRSYIDIFQLDDTSNRTLLLGENNHTKVHVYIKGRILVKYMYEGPSPPSCVKEYLSLGDMQFTTVYSRQSDFEFCEYLIERGCKLPLVTSEFVPAQPYYGPLLEG